MDVLDIQQRPRQNDASTPAKRASPMKNLPPLALIAALAVAACSAPAATEAAPADTAKLDGSGDHPATPLADAPFTAPEVADFHEPWAITFVNVTRDALITENSGQLTLWQEHGPTQDVPGGPAGSYRSPGSLRGLIA